MNTLSGMYVKPVSDNETEYDAVTHRWVLTNAVISTYEKYLSGDRIRLKALSISQHVYQYIKHTAITTYNFPFAEWVYSCTNEGRELIKSCLMAQLIADAESGIDGTANQARINFSNGMAISKKEVREARLCEDAKDMIDDFCLNVNGAPYQLSKRFFLGFALPDDRYSIWEY